MLPFLAGLRAKPPFDSTLRLPAEKVLILFKLPFEAEVGEDYWARLSDKLYCIFEAPAFLSHQISAYQC